MTMDELTSAEMDYFRTRYGLFDYQLWTLNRLLREVEVRGRTVLEVGGSNLPRELVIGRLKAESWHCIDVIPSGHYSLTAQAPHYSLERIKPLREFHPAHLAERYNIFDGMIHDSGALPEAHFEVVLSIASFEHITDLAGALRAIRRLMKPGASLYSNFGPIWSCRVGHHIWVNDRLNFMVEDSVPPFAHLLQSRTELFDGLAERYGSAPAEAAVGQIFDSDFVNRLFYEDYEALVRDAAFSTANVVSSWEEEVAPELQSVLEARYPGRRHFGTYNMQILCQA